MGENTKIEWADHTFNPWVGCMKVSEACRNCYAESWAKRTGSPELWRGERRRTTPANWRKPLKWNAAAKAGGFRARVFCASLADVFEDLPRLDEVRRDLFLLIRETPHLDWLLLTKRPEAIRWRLPDDWGKGYPNVWLGTTVEDQASAAKRLPELWRVPAAVKFVSAEPLLGPLDLRQVRVPFGPGDEGIPVDYLWQDPDGTPGGLDWVIAGGESGRRARPMQPSWARDLRDQCASAGVPFMFKQWGAWGPRDGGMVQTGKKSTGRELDGREHLEFPTRPVPATPASLFDRHGEER